MTNYKNQILGETFDKISKIKSFDVIVKKREGGVLDKVKRRVRFWEYRPHDMWQIEGFIFRIRMYDDNLWIAFDYHDIEDEVKFISFAIKEGIETKLKGEIICIPYDVGTSQGLNHGERGLIIDFKLDNWETFTTMKEAKSKIEKYKIHKALGNIIKNKTTQKRKI